MNGGQCCGATGGSSMFVDKQLVTSHTGGGIGMSILMAIITNPIFWIVLVVLYIYFFYWAAIKQKLKDLNPLGKIGTGVKKTGKKLSKGVKKTGKKLSKGAAKGAKNLLKATKKIKPPKIKNPFKKK